MFLMMSLLWGTLLAAIPILVHLMHRQRTTPVDWGAMQFLMNTPVKMRAQKWIDNWLLLLIRMLVIAALAMLLARPLLKTGQVKAKTPMDVAVVIDHSLSTGRIMDGKTLFVSGTDVIAQVKDILPAGSTMSIVLAEHTPKLITPLPISTDTEIARVVGQLRQLKPGLTDASIPLAVQEARRQLVSAGKNLKKMIVVVSDDQRSGWMPDNPTPWLAALGDRNSGQDKDLALYAVSMRNKDADKLKTNLNVSIAGLTIQPGMLALSRPSQITFTVTNQGPAKSPGFDVKIAVDGKDVDVEKVPALAEGKSQTFSLPYMFQTAGSHYVRVTAETKDTLEADNTAVTAVKVVPTVKVLIIDGQALDADRGGFSKAGFLNDALLAAGTAQPTVIGTADAGATNLDEYSVVVLNDVPRLTDAVVQKLVEHVQRGSGLWLILGPRTDSNWINETLAKTPLFTGKLNERLTPQKGAGLVEIRAASNPTIAMLTEAEQNAFAGAAITSWWNAASLGADEATILSISADGATYPLALEHAVPGLGGKVVTWTISAERSSGTLPLAMNFLPLVNETVFHLASGTTRAADFQLFQGQEIFWTAPKGINPTSAKVIRPDAAQADATLRIMMGRSQITYADTALPGLYELKLEGAGPDKKSAGPIYFGVSIDPSELEGRTMTAAEFDAMRESKLITGHATPEQFAVAQSVFEVESQGTDIARWLALAVVAFIIVEAFLTKRAAKVQSGKDAKELLEVT